MGPMKTVHPWRLLEPEGFQETSGGFLIDLFGESIEAQVNKWYTDVAQLVDTITPKHLLNSVTLWFTE